jgi:hypothetical protein
MASLMTKCNGCCFFDTKDSSCELDLHNVFRNVNAKVEVVDGVCLVDRICQYRRTEDWNDNKSLEEKMQICKNEVYLSGTIVLIADNIDNLSNAIDELIAPSRSMDLEVLSRSKPSIIDQFKFIVLYRDINYNKLLELCGNCFKQYKLINYLTDDIEYHIHQSLKYARNGYLFILDSNKKIDVSIIDKVNNFVNIKLMRLLHVSGNDGLHESVSMVHIYKWLKGDLQIPFELKLKDISSQENSDPQTLTWKEINEQYSS